MSNPKTPKQVLDFAKENDVRMVDFKFCDLMGTWQHFATPLHQLSDDVFEDGLGFDGSSIRGWKAIHNSDMLVIPECESARLDPFALRPTLSLICNVHDAITKAPYERDPRNVARKAEAFLKETGLADTWMKGQTSVISLDTKAAIFRYSPPIRWSTFVTKWLRS